VKLFSTTLEQIAIRSICSSEEKVAALLLSSLDTSFFHYEPCKAAFERIRSVAKKRSVILEYTELLEDPALGEDFRDILREGDVRRCRSTTKAKRLISSLDKYRKARQLYEMAKNVIETLKKESVDVEAVMDDVADVLTVARSREDIAELIHTLGKDGNAIDLADEAMSVEDEVLLKTGYKEVDDKNGGVPSDGVMLLAATTSGGKSTLLMNLLMNMYKINKVSVANVSLEMNKNKLTRRMLSRMTRIPYWKYVKKALTKEERIASRKAWRRFHNYGVKYDCKHSLICPTHSVGITSLLTTLRPYGYRVIGIDYISLLEGVDEKDQWRILSSITREAKIFSAENKCLVILLAQLDADDERIRYSKGILEHVDAAWTWNYYKPEVKETKTLPIKQVKARDAMLYPFELREDFETMSVLNMDEDAAPSSSDPSQAGQTDKLDLNAEPEMTYEAGQA
jgi:Replicative DNA helicase